ncbi:MAG: hypothetical protein KF729_23395 [Sandaracinaceae bacterium]|nr:hypothetical protein [Sandaracinaceae bacterium]
MSDGAKPHVFDKGDRAAIVSGRKNPIGVRGQIFWIGDNKYGDGKRYGLRGDDGETYWCDGTTLGPEETAPPPPPAAGPKTALDKGARVTITKGPSAGTEGEVFWVGESRYGAGMRYGIKDAEGETHWADSHQVEALEGAPPPRSAPPSAPPARAPRPSADAAPPIDDAPLPEAGDDAEPERFYDEDIPFDGDDLPF